MWRSRVITRRNTGPSAIGGEPPCTPPWPAWPRWRWRSGRQLDRCVDGHGAAEAVGLQPGQIPADGGGIGVALAVQPAQEGRGPIGQVPFRQGRHGSPPVPRGSLGRRHPDRGRSSAAESDRAAAPDRAGASSHGAAACVLAVAWPSGCGLSRPASSVCSTGTRSSWWVGTTAQIAAKPSARDGPKCGSARAAAISWITGTGTGR